LQSHLEGKETSRSRPVDHERLACPPSVLILGSEADWVGSRPTCAQCSPRPPLRVTLLLHLEQEDTVQVVAGRGHKVVERADCNDALPTGRRRRLRCAATRDSPSGLYGLYHGPRFPGW